MITSYVEGRREGTRKRPSALVVAVRESPVPASVTLIVAEATVDPDGSITVPTKLPDPCAREITGKRRRARDNRIVDFFICCLLRPGRPVPRLSRSLKTGEPLHRTPLVHPGPQVYEVSDRRIVAINSLDSV